MDENNAKLNENNGRITIVPKEPTQSINQDNKTKLEALSKSKKIQE